MIGPLLAHGFEGADWPSRETGPRCLSQRHHAHALSVVTTPGVGTVVRPVLAHQGLQGSVDDGERTGRVRL
jgi:hypothetical protein